MNRGVAIVKKISKSKLKLFRGKFEWCSYVTNGGKHAVENFVLQQRIDAAFAEKN